MSDTTPRDQLAQIINEHMEADVPETVADKHEPVDADYAMADAIVNAGWRPPVRVVTTVEEVEALKEGALLAIERWGRMWVYERRKDSAWCLSIVGWGWLDEDWLPATVIYEPEEGE